MNKIKKIEKLMRVWKAAEKSAHREDTFLHEYHSRGMYLGLKTALAVFERPSNKKIPTGEKSCAKYHRMFSDKDDICGVCGKPWNPDF